MSNTDKSIGQFVFEDAVVGNFLNVVNARSYKGGGNPQFDANLEITSEADIAAMKKVARAVAQAKWPNLSLADAVKSGELIVPWKSGDTLADQAKAKGKDREYSRGRTVLIARSNTDFPPQLGQLTGGRIVMYDQRERARDVFWPGVELLAEVFFRADEAQGKKYVSAKLVQLVSTNRGVRLGGGPRPAAEVFKAHVGRYSDEDAGAPEQELAEADGF